MQPQIWKSLLAVSKQCLAQRAKRAAIRPAFDKGRFGFEDRVDEQSFIAIVIEAYLYLRVIKTMRSQYLSQNVLDKGLRRFGHLPCPAIFDLECKAKDS